MGRSHSKEKDWLREAAGEAEVNVPAPTFVSLAAERLDKGAAEYGDDAFLERGEELLAEAQEEGIDAPAWLVLFVQWLEREVERGYPEAHAALVNKHLQSAAACFLTGWQQVEDARETYREGLGEAAIPAGPPEPPPTHFYED
jgi:hypothetical protein